MSVKRPHDELLSSTTPLALQSVVEMRSKRPRATDLLSPNDAHTYNSAEVRTQLENGWMLNRAAQKVIANLRASLAPEDVKSRICTEVLSTPLPCFPLADSNAYHGQPVDAVKKIYGLFPTVLISSNTQGLHSPPPPNMPVSVDDEWNFQRPISFNSNHQTHPYRALMHRPHCVASHDLESYRSHGSQRWELSASCAEDMILRAQSVMNRAFAFGAELQRLRVLASQADGNLHVDHSSWVAHELLYDINALLDIPTLRKNIQRSFETKGELELFAQYLENRIACGMGSADVLVLHALDACALLGGRELPHWPAQKHWRGAYVHPQVARESQQPHDESTRQMLALIRRYERWGVPLWCFVYNKAGFRVDLGIDGGPVRVDAEERRYQARLASLKPKTKTKEVDYEEVLLVVQHSRLNPAQSAVESPSLPIGEPRMRLESAILLFLDHLRPGYLPFDKFSAIIVDILGNKIWPNTRHEELLHRQHFVQGERESWSRIWDGFVECNHLGVIFSALEIPPPWYSSHSHALSSYGEGKLISHPSGEVHVPLQALPLGSWHILDLDDFGTGAVEDATITRIEQMERGVHGWSFSQSFVPFKNSEGRSIRQSRHVLSLVFKVEAELTEVSLDLKSRRPNQSQRIVHRSAQTLGDLGVFEWEKHPRYIDIVYARCTGLNALSELIRLAPRFAIPNSGSGDADERALATKKMVHRMRYEELFEVDRFPPLVIAVSTVASQSRDMSKCSLDTFLQLAFAARESKDLTFLDVVWLQRLACILFCLNEEPKPHFLCHIFRSDGPYLRILQYMGFTIRQNQHLEGSQFVPRMQRPRMTPFFEGLTLSSGTVEIFLDLDTPVDHIAMPSQEELEAHERKLGELWEAFRKKLSRSERKRQQRHKASQSVIGDSSLS